MKKKMVWLGVGMLLIFGCARVRVEAPKEAIKMDITMRLDIYQHVQKDITDIENIVSSPKQSPSASDKSSLRNILIPQAFAEDALSPEVEQAALRRKERRPALSALESKAVAGEDKSGLVQIRKPEAANKDANDLIQAENNDRMVIYRYISQKNNLALEEVQKMYSERLQQDAPAGTPVQAPNASDWKVK